MTPPIYIVLKIILEPYDAVINSVECVGKFETQGLAEEHKQEILEGITKQNQFCYQTVKDYVLSKGVENMSEYDPYRGGTNAGDPQRITSNIINGIKKPPDLVIPKIDHNNYEFIVCEVL